MIAIHNGEALYAGDLSLREDGLYGRGFVDKSLNPSNTQLIDVPIPQPWQGTGYTWDGTTFTRQAWFETQIRADAKAAKASQINIDFQNAVTVVKDGYTDEEIETWYRQELEARNYRGNPNAGDTPIIDAIVAAKGSTREAVVTSIETLATQYAEAVGGALGQKQARQAALEAIDLNAADALEQINQV